MRTKLLWLLVVLAILLSACGGNTPTPEAASTPAPGAQPTPPRCESNDGAVRRQRI